MKKYWVLWLMLVVSAAAEASIVSIDFETSEGYPAASIGRLYDHGWYDTTSSWFVPSLADTFANTGARSAKMGAMWIQQDWCNYAAAWTPSANETTVSYSAHMAFQRPSYGNPGAGTYGGIALRGKKADATEVVLGGMQLCVDGTVTMWGYPNGTSSTTITSSYAYTINSWYQLGIKADFATDTVQFLLGGASVNSLSFGSDVISLSSIALYCGDTIKDSGHNIRYDTIQVEVPEPMTLSLLALGGVLMAKRRK